MNDIVNDILDAASRAKAIAEVIRLACTSDQADATMLCLAVSCSILKDELNVIECVVERINANSVDGNAV